MALMRRSKLSELNARRDEIVARQTAEAGTLALRLRLLQVAGAFYGFWEGIGLMVESTRPISTRRLMARACGVFPGTRGSAFP